jgi:hydrogenase expression/formation protein HypC
MELVEHDGHRGIARLGEVRREVNLMLVPDVNIGDFVIIHAGCAISVLDRAEAQKTLDILRAAGPLGDET